MFISYKIDPTLGYVTFGSYLHVYVHLPAVIWTPGDMCVTCRQMWQLLSQPSSFVVLMLSFILKEGCYFTGKRGGLRGQER